VTVPAFGGATWTTKNEIVISTRGAMLVISDGGGGVPRSVLRSSADKGETFQLVPLALDDGETVLYSSAASGSVSSRIGVFWLTTGKSAVLDLAGIEPLGVVDGQLIYVTATGALMAVPFDSKHARVTGNPVQMVSDIMINQATNTSRAAVSRNGTLVLQTGSLTAQALLADVHGATKPLLAEARSFSYPRYSPDGKTIAITATTAARSDVWLYDIAAGTPTRLTTEGSVNERAEWTPDGKRVLYRTDNGGRAAIWWRPVDLSSPAQPLLASDHANFFEGVLSGDGKYLAYQLDTAGADVYFRAMSGDTTPKPVAATKFAEDMARISPDGKWIVYVTDQSGSNQVVVRPFPGLGGETRISINGGAEPVWSRDSHKIFYRGSQQFIAATLSADPVLTVVSREVLFDDTYLGAGLPHANYDVAPDGAHFVVLKGAEAAQVLVVHNWVAELRARLKSVAKK
jgi:hypothetical protein